jgi:hypothetical protein
MSQEFVIIMCMENKRAFRRFQLEKKKKEAMGRFWYADTPRMIGILANTPCPYSDYDHGHARFWHGDTCQEKLLERMRYWTVGYPYVRTNTAPFILIRKMLDDWRKKKP